MLCRIGDLDSGQKFDHCQDAIHGENVGWNRVLYELIQTLLLGGLCPTIHYEVDLVFRRESHSPKCRTMRFRRHQAKNRCCRASFVTVVLWSQPIESSVMTVDCEISQSTEDFVLEVFYYLRR